MDDLLTIVELASRLKVPVATARKLVVSGTVRGFKVGNRWRVVTSDLSAYIDHQRAKTMRYAPVDVTRLPGFPKKRVFG